VVTFPDVFFPAKTFPGCSFSRMERFLEKNCSWMVMFSYNCLAGLRGDDLARQLRVVAVNHLGLSTASPNQQRSWGFHRRINGIARRSHVSFYMTVDLLFHKAQLHLLSDGKAGVAPNQHTLRRCQPAPDGAVVAVRRRPAACRRHGSCVLQAACSCTTKNEWLFETRETARTE